MLAASLLLMQILSETFTPKEKDQCVGVTYKGVTYKGQKASRSRFTGRVVVTMPDKLTLPYDPEFDRYLSATVRCSQDCDQKLAKDRPYDLCIKGCERPGIFSKDPLLGNPTDVSPECQRSCESQPKVPPASAHTSCENARMATVPTPNPSRPRAPMPSPKPGRQIDLGGADIIVDSTSCTCPYATQCVDK